MENAILKVIYFIVHVLVEWIEAFYYFALRFRESIYNFINIAFRERQTRSPLKNEKVLIEQRIQEIKKIPKHLAVILNIKSERDVALSRLADLVQWSLCSGVNFISFYDVKGTWNFALYLSLVTSLDPKKQCFKIQSHDELNYFICHYN